MRTTGSPRPTGVPAVVIGGSGVPRASLAVRRKVVDRWGFELTSTEAGQQSWEAAMMALMAMSGEVPRLLDTVAAVDPDLAVGRALRAFVNGLLPVPAWDTEAELAAAERMLPEISPRERGLVQSFGRLVRSGPLAALRPLRDHLAPRDASAAHALMHCHYETGEHAAGLRWLAGWLAGGTSLGHFKVHFPWHAAMHELATGDLDAARRRCGTQISAADTTDIAPLLWRFRLTKAPVDSDLARAAASVSVRAGQPVPSALAGLNLALCLAAAGEVAGLDGFARHTSGDPRPEVAGLLAPLARGLAALLGQRPRDAVELLAPVAAPAAGLGGSRMQRDIVEDTLMLALIDAGQLAVVTDGLGRPAGFLSVFVSVQAGAAILGSIVSARIVKRLGEIAAAGLAFTLAAVAMFLTVFPVLAVVVAAYALAGLAVPIGTVSAYNAAQRRIPAQLFARTMVAFTCAVGLPQAMSLPIAAAALGSVGFRPLVLVCFAIAILAAAYLWRGRALTQPGRRRRRRPVPLAEASARG